MSSCGIRGRTGIRQRPVGSGDAAALVWGWGCWCRVLLRVQSRGNEGWEDFGCQECRGVEGRMWMLILWLLKVLGFVTMGIQY